MTKPILNKTCVVVLWHLALILCCNNLNSFVNAFGPIPVTRTLSFQRATLPSDRWGPQHPRQMSAVDDTPPPSPIPSIIKNDPIAQEFRLIQSMNLNAIINSSLIVAVAMIVLSKCATVDYEIMRGWTPSEMAVRIPVDNWLGYSAVLDRAPVFTKAVTSATVYTIGDFIAQRTEGTDMGDIDRGRILRSLLAGLIGHGPLSHVWYNVSEGLFNDVLHWTAWWSFFPKVVLDQTTWGPFWNNTYIILLGIMKRDKLEQMWGDIKRTTIPLVVSGLKLWPLAHCITYGLIPVENRLLWVDLVEIVWVTILATQAAGGVDSETGEANTAVTGGEGMNLEMEIPDVKEAAQERA